MYDVTAAVPQGPPPSRANDRASGCLGGGLAMLAVMRWVYRVLLILLAVSVVTAIVTQSWFWGITAGVVLAVVLVLAISTS